VPAQSSHIRTVFTHLASLSLSLLFFITSLQSAAAQSSAAIADKMPDWQVAAGGQMKFEVASIKPDTVDQADAIVYSNIPLGPMDSFTPTGGLLRSTSFDLLQYLVFAYKLTPTQVQSVQAQLPKWTNTAQYDIEAHAAGNPTKDQYRLMMQALLADRFKLALHYETKQVPAIALELDKPGKFGPHIQLHPVDATPCSSAPAPGQTVDGGFPVQCGIVGAGQSSTPGRLKVLARNVRITMLTDLLGSQPVINIDKPVVDKTGIVGNVDFVFEFTPDVPPGTDFQPDQNGPTFLEALKEQMGMKLDPTTAAVDSIIIDHIEQPSAN
jgi:uncharacterized protein (TIGR03435 family)